MTRRWTEQDRLDQIVTMNAINRLIDSTIRTLEKHPRDADARGNIEDWRACRCTVETLWRQAQEVAYGRGFPR